LISIFYEFIEVENYLLVVCELDITAFNLKGEKLWETSFMDIVENFEIIKNAIMVHCAGRKIEINLKNGYHTFID